jgi:fumarate hydratase subunit beta
MNTFRITSPITDEMIKKFEVGDIILISGYIFTGRDAVLPKIVGLIKSGKLTEAGIDLKGSVIFHTAVSPAGIGPTSSNKYEIESSIPALSQAGVKIHIGKGTLSKSTIESLKVNNSVYAITPPTSALFASKVKSQKVIAFEEEGMEALHLLEVEEFPAIIASVNGETISTK